MTKEELMKYANDPFWIKLRWFLFILFWLAWIGMLFGAIAIIIFAPKCAAPTPVAWYKKGPLAIINGAVDDSVIEKMKNFEVQGVVYELPGHETYKVESGEVHERIKAIVDKFKAKDIHVVIDLTPNFVTREDDLFRDATKDVPDQESLGAFITNDAPLNWKQVDKTESAWKKAGKNTHFLSQFSDYYDVRLNKPIVQEKLKNVISTLADIGVKGFRFVNAKYLIVAETVLENEAPRSKPQGDREDFKFYAHHQREFSEGLKDLIHSYNRFVLNATNDEGFLAIRDDISDHTENFAVSERIDAFELPRFGFINSYLRSAKKNEVAEGLFNGFQTVGRNVDLSSIWTQIEYAKATYENLEESAYKLFISFLRGVQIASLDDLVYTLNDNGEIYKKLQAERESRAAVFEHGNFNYYLSNNASAFAYSR
jgi:solute carrier family 3 protein 2